MLFDKDGQRFVDFIFGSEISRLQLPEFDQNPSQDSFSFRLDEDVFFTHLPLYYSARNELDGVVSVICS